MLHNSIKQTQVCLTRSLTPFVYSTARSTQMSESPSASDSDLLPKRRSARGHSDTHVYLVREGASVSGTLLLAGGVALIGFGLLAFVVCLVVRVNQFALHAVTTLPIVMGLGAITRGWGAVRSPTQITVDPAEITITTGQTDRRIAWNDIGLASATEAPLTNKRRLALFDKRGKPLVTIHNNFTDFEQLVDLARGYVDAQPEGDADSLQLSKARRTALFTGVVGVFLGVAGVFSAHDTWNTQREQALLASDGVEGEGRKLRRFLAPNGVTCRLEYEVAGDGGQTATRNAEVEPEYWNELEDATTVPIRFVPAEPEISRLLSGEAPSDKPGPLAGYGLGVAGGCMSLFMIAVAVMQFKGWDYGTDPKTGKLGFRRIGE